MILLKVLTVSSTPEAADIKKVSSSEGEGGGGKTPQAQDKVGARTPAARGARAASREHEADDGERRRGERARR